MTSLNKKSIYFKKAVPKCEMYKMWWLGMGRKKWGKMRQKIGNVLETSKNRPKNITQDYKKKSVIIYYRKIMNEDFQNKKSVI